MAISNDPTTPARILPVGTPATIAHYEIHAILGDGGTSCVYLAFDRYLHRFVVLKVLRKASPADTATQELARREASILEPVNHPSLPKVYAVHEDGDALAIVEEHIEGERLRDFMERHGPCEPNDVCDLLLQIGSALQAVHDNGIVHGDVKPENILLRQNGPACLIDFGYSNIASECPLDLRGTIAYMSPEQARGEAITESSDLFSLAAVATEMLTAMPLFDGDTPAELRQNVMTFAGSPPARTNQLPILRHALEPLAASRYELDAFLRAIFRARWRINPLEREERTPRIHERIRSARVRFSAQRDIRGGLPQVRDGSSSAVDDVPRYRPITLQNVCCRDVLSSMSERCDVDDASR